MLIYVYMNMHIIKRLIGVFIITIIIGASYVTPSVPTASACSYVQGTFLPKLSDILAKNSISSVYTFVGTITNAVSANGYYTDNPLSVQMNNYYNDGTVTAAEVVVPETFTLHNSGTSCGISFNRKYVVITGTLEDLSKGVIADTGQITLHNTLAEARAEANRIKQLLTPTPTPAPVPSGCNVLSVGSHRMVRGNRGENVRALQQTLNRVNYNNNTTQLITDGVFGRGTLAAVRAFQTMNNLTADGIAGPKTIQKMCENNPLPI